MANFEKAHNVPSDNNDFSNQGLSSCNVKEAGMEVLVSPLGPCPFLQVPGLGIEGLSCGIHCGASRSGTEIEPGTPWFTCGEQGALELVDES